MENKPTCSFGEDLHISGQVLLMGATSVTTLSVVAQVYRRVLR